VVNENDKEQEEVFTPYVEYKMQVSKPIFNIGFKDIQIPKDPVERQRKDAAMSILDEMIFARSGKLYQSLIERDLISPSLSYGYTMSRGAAYHSIAGEADDPKLVLEIIEDYIRELKKKGLCRDDFDLAMRVMYAEFVKSFDSTESVANNLFSFICEDSDLLSYQDVLASVTFREVCELFENTFLPHTVALSVVRPLPNQFNEQE
jgi:predicted Zn-dependent peptidase